MAMVMIFVDGLGLGPDEPDLNPLARASMPTMRRLLDGVPLTAPAGAEPGQPLVANERAVLVPVDARLGVPGLPQSATGQTALLTGVNGAKALGRHVSGAPTPTLAKILRAHSIFKQLGAAGLTGTFANPFTADYFEAVEAGRMRLSATTTALLGGGLEPRMLEDLLAGRAVFHDITGAGLRERGHEVPLVSPREAGRRLAALASNWDFTLFEYFLTDMAGHAQDVDMALRLLEQLDAFIGSVLEHVDLDENLVLLISDHGNVEDLSVKTHTFNHVPALVAGRGKDELARRLRSLTDVTPAVVDCLRRRRHERRELPRRLAATGRMEPRSGSSSDRASGGLRDE